MMGHNIRIAQTLHERNKTIRSCAGQVDGFSESVADRSLLLIGESGGIAPLPCRLLVRTAVGGADELDRRQDHQHRPKQRHPAAGEEGGQADAEHGWKYKGERLRISHCQFDVRLNRNGAIALQSGGARGIVIS